MAIRRISKLETLVCFVLILFSFFYPFYLIADFFNRWNFPFIGNVFLLISVLSALIFLYHYSFGHDGYSEISNEIYKVYKYSVFSFHRDKWNELSGGFLIIISYNIFALIGFVWELITSWESITSDVFSIYLQGFLFINSIGIIVMFISRNSKVYASIINPFTNEDKDVIKYTWDSPFHLLGVRYLDYFEKKISDDEPHLENGQELDVTVKEFPRDEDEKNTVFLYNNRTPGNKALVYRLRDADWADLARAGRVKARVIVKADPVFKLDIFIWVDELPVDQADSNFQ
jgi:hypothetical protein